MAEIDWTQSMAQTFSFYEVDPVTWFDKKTIRGIKSVNITRDVENETIQHATIEGVGIEKEMYVRVYLDVIQNRTHFRECLGTFLVQTPGSTFDGKERSMSIDSYSTLVELKEDYPPIGFTVLKDESIMGRAKELIQSRARAKVIPSADESKMIEVDSGFVANTDDTYLTYITDLIANAGYTLDVDPYGSIFFQPKVNVSRLTPKWTYSDDNSSILYPSISVNRDLYGMPNVIEMVHSTKDDFYVARAVNDNPDSPISTVSRGREVVKRITSPDTLAGGSHQQLDDYAEQALIAASMLEYRLSYTHGYCPVRLGDCVRLNYIRAGINNVRAKVVSQNIKCETGCSVSEEAVFTSSLWK